MLKQVYSSDLFRGAIFECCGGNEKFSCEEFSFGNEIVFPLKGTFIRKNSKGTDLGDKTRALFFQKGETYQISHPDPGPDVSFILFPRGGKLDHFGNEGYFFPHGKVQIGPAQMLSVLTIADNLMAGKETDKLALDEAMINLAGALFYQGLENLWPYAQKRGSLNELHGRIVNRAVLFINRNFRSKISIREIATAAFSAPFHLCRLFRAETGLTLHGYVTRLRLREALEELKIPELSITDIALGLGFNSHSHFGQTFKGIYGLTPSQYRQLKSASSAYFY